MSSRDAILGRIRNALSATGTAGRLPDGAVIPPVPEVWPQQNPEPATMAEQFVEELQAVDGEVYRCGSMDQARKKLAELISQSGWDSIGAVDGPLCRELTGELAPDRVEWAAADWGPGEMADLAAGLVAAQFLLADTGSCVVACGTAGQRLMCYLPPACVVVGRVDQLVEHMPAAWDEIARRAADPESRGECVLITGPSRTADIEKILILGVHGPKRLIVLLVE